MSKYTKKKKSFFDKFHTSTGYETQTFPTPPPQIAKVRLKFIPIKIQTSVIT